MKGLALEKLILGHIINQPSLLKKIDIDNAFFSTDKLRLVFEQVQKGLNDLVLISQKIGGKGIVSFCSSLLDGVPHTSAENLQEYINKIKIDRIKLEILKLIHSGSQSGFFDHDKIEDLHTIIKTLEIPTDKLAAFNLASVDTKPIDWFWYNKIPSNSLCFLVGNPGAGKSTLSLYMAAAVTTGRDWPDVGRPPGTKPANVIYFTDEDNMADTIKPRAEAMGADSKRITVIKGMIPHSHDYFDIRKHLPLLEQHIDSTKNVKLVIFDPITAYMGNTRGNELIPTHAALSPLAYYSENQQFLSLCIHHMNKDSTKDALYRIAGSIAFTAAPRSIWLVDEDKDNPDLKKRFLAPLKFNVLVNPTTLSFAISGPMGKPHITFDPLPVDKTASDILADNETKDRTTAVDEARKFLLETLKDGAVESKILHEWAADNSISSISIVRAKKTIKYECFQEKGKHFTRLV